MSKPILVFDLNGTLLDLSVLDPLFDRSFGVTGMRERWFEKLQILWMTTIAASPYRPFDALAEAALDMLSEREQTAVQTSDRSAILSALTQLPAYPDVSAALGQLRAAGFVI